MIMQMTMHLGGFCSATWGEIGGLFTTKAF
jgi:hypothetical protein